MKLSGHQINAEPWPFSQSSFCDRRRPAALVQTSCSPTDVIGATRGVRGSVGSRGDRAVSFSHCPGKWVMRDQPFFEVGISTAAASTGCCAAGKQDLSQRSPSADKAPCRGWAGLPERRLCCFAVHRVKEP